MDAPGDSFTRNLFAWQDQVLADRGLTPICLHVALTIARHINRQTGEAWPSQETIAEALSITARAVRSAVDQLASRDHLIVAVRHGRGDSNRYRPRLKNRNDGSGIAHEKGNNGSGFDCEKRNHGSGIGTDNRNSGSGITGENRNDGSYETGTMVPLRA